MSIALWAFGALLFAEGLFLLAILLSPATRLDSCPACNPALTFDFYQRLGTLEKTSRLQLVRKYRCRTCKHAYFAN